jgi:two-component sensor histidine kinase
MIADRASQTTIAESQDVIREVHHQVKNTLQVVCSLLRLEERSVNESTARESLRRSEGRVQSMALVYDTLYREGSCLEVPIDRYIRILTDHVVKSWGPGGRSPEVEYFLTPLSMPTKGAISCGVILNEVLIHCLTIAAAHNGPSSLQVKSDAYKKGLSLWVELEHEGLAPHEFAKLSGQIVRALVQQYGGSLEVHGADGLRYSINLPGLAGQ